MNALLLPPIKPIHSTGIMTSIKLIPCASCEAAAEIRHETGVGFIAEYSNRIDCPVWPMTQPQPTADEAAEKWNAGETEN